jgi:hypothetical protein
VRKADDHLVVRRLRDFQIVGLQVRDVQATCRIVAVGGGEAVLEPERRRDFAHAVLPLRATLSFETERHPVMLSGMVGEGPVPGSLRFWVTDSIGLRELRLRPRLNAEFDVLLRPLGADGTPGAPMVRKTIDVSAGGILAAGQLAAAGSTFALEMPVPGLRRPVACGARVVRELPIGAALEFLDLDPGIEQTLDQLIFTVRQQVARRAFTAASARSAARAA